MEYRLLVTGGSGFIGTNLTEYLANSGIEFFNVDIRSPKKTELSNFWINCDILDFEKLTAVFDKVRPNIVIHLAAETDTDPNKTLDDYFVNTQGTYNVLNASKSVESVVHFVLTSTQFVNQSLKGPADDEDYDPHTVYGESKMLTEKYLRSNSYPFTWTIIRPTNIWGPWHLRYPFEFWKVLSENKYFHPGRNKVIRSYGYVGNVVFQIEQIFKLPRESMHGKVYYVGDEPIDIYDWVNGFSKKQTGKSVTVLPRFFVFGLALFGELLRKIGLRFPINLSRYSSMTTDNPANMGRTFAELGPAPFSLDQGIDQTVNWMRKYHPKLVKS